MTQRAEVAAPRVRQARRALHVDLLYQNEDGAAGGDRLILAFDDYGGRRYEPHVPILVR